MAEIDEIIKASDSGITIAQLKSKRGTEQPDITASIKALDPLKHEVFNTIKRPNKKVKIDPEETEGQVSSQTAEYRYELVARVALALQKLIIKRAVSFIFGNPVELSCTPGSDNEKAILKAIKRVLFDAKSKSVNRRVARQLFSCTEVAELWYPVEKQNSTYGFDSKFKLRCAVFSPLLGDRLYPYFDESGDMVAFSREFSVTGTDNKSITYFETYTTEFHYIWIPNESGYVMAEGFPEPNVIGKIPIVYGSQPEVEWNDVQNLIDRLEKLLSNFADTNDYHASPKIFVKGNLVGFAKKGESGAILQGEENSSAEYLSWANAPESVKLEIETLLRMIYTLTQTPDISFDAVKGLGNISGIALKLLFLDAHLKVADHQEVFDEYLQRRINIITAFIGKFNTTLSIDAENIIIEPVIKPYMVVDEAAELKIWTDANGGNPVISQKASFQKAVLTNDPDADYEQYQEEQKNKNSFSINEPTI